MHYRSDLVHLKKVMTYINFFTAFLQENKFFFWKSKGNLFSFVFPKEIYFSFAFPKEIYFPLNFQKKFIFFCISKENLFYLHLQRKFIFFCISKEILFYEIYLKTSSQHFFGSKNILCLAVEYLFQVNTYLSHANSLI